MDNEHPETDPKSFVFTITDLRQAANEGVISPEAAADLISWGYEREAKFVRDRGLSSQAAIEQPKGFNLVMVAYYFGAMLMISACAWFLGDKWDSLGPVGILVTSVFYAAIAAGVGLWLCEKGYSVGGGLLITVAVCMVPLITYSIEDILGIWPGDRPGDYKDFYPWIRGSWIVMELATIAAGLLTLRYIRFAFLTAPIAFSFWFLSMDLAAWIIGDASLDWNSRAWVSICVGFFTMFVGYCLQRSLRQPERRHAEDFAFWCYLFGLMAFWGGMTSLDSDSELGRLVYAVINLGLIGIAVKLRRAVFLVFGAIGVHVYLGHLAYAVFKDSFLFPFALAGLGLSLILVTVWAQRFIKAERSSEAPGTF
jgi:hypothetical protein